MPDRKANDGIPGNCWLRAPPGPARPTGATPRNAAASKPRASIDDESWTLRWIVVDTGTWLSGRKVLLPISVPGHPDAATRTFPVRLTKAKVKDSPEVDAQ